MNRSTLRTFSMTGLAALLAAALTVPAFPQPPGGGPWGGGGPHAQNATQTPATVSGTIVQFNYDHDAAINGFLLSGNVLVHLPPAVANKLAGSLKLNDAMSVTGNEFTDATSGWTVVMAHSVTDSTAGVTVTLPAPSTTTVSGTGVIKQLNYAGPGDVNGFWLDASTLLVMPPVAPGTAVAFTVGASVTYTAYTRVTLNNTTVLMPTALTVGGTTIALSGPGRRGFGGPAGPPPPGW